MFFNLKKLVKMRNSVFSLMVAAILLMAFPTQSKADDETKKEAAPEVKTEAAVEVDNMINRLEEIKAMDLSELTRTEKKELRKEVRSIKKDLNEYSKGDGTAVATADAKGEGEAVTGVYISGGAIIVILLLLLLL